VYHFCDPTLMDDSTTSPNMSRGTAHPSLRPFALQNGRFCRMQDREL
jgi:hypothetical protein